MASSPSPGYSITLRVAVSSSAGSTTDLASAVAETGAAVTALDIVESSHDAIVVDVTCNTVDEEHAEKISEVINSRPGMTVRKVSDRTFLLHLGGKLSVEPKVPLKNRDDLSRAYTPGVARVCLAIAANPEDARRLTIKRNTVAVVTDGTAVLGLGDIGPAAALPVMEGKAALFKQFAGVDAWPVCLDTKDTEEIISIVKALAPVYGGVNLEDISAPRCFEIERRLRDELDIPVFHDDQHGTAIVVLAALINALRVVDKKMGEVKIVVSGVGAAGQRHHPAAAGPGRRSTSSGWPAPVRSTAARPTPTSTGRGSPRTPTTKASPAPCTRPWSGRTCSSASPVRTCSGPTRSPPWPRVRSCWPWPTPTRRSIPSEAAKHAAVVATGRSDFPNQINNVLAFPGLFRGLLDAAASDITTPMLVAAAEAIADCVSADELNPSYIVPSVFDARVAPAVAEAVVQQAHS